METEHANLLITMACVDKFYLHSQVVAEKCLETVYLFGDNFPRLFSGFNKRRHEMLALALTTYPNSAKIKSMHGTIPSIFRSKDQNFIAFFSGDAFEGKGTKRVYGLYRTALGYKGDSRSRESSMANLHNSRITPQRAEQRRRSLGANLLR